jgi:hypothetical protein
LVPTITPTRQRGQRPARICCNNPPGQESGCGELHRWSFSLSGPDRKGREAVAIILNLYPDGLALRKGLQPKPPPIIRRYVGGPARRLGTFLRPLYDLAYRFPDADDGQADPGRRPPIRGQELTDDVGADSQTQIS